MSDVGVVAVRHRDDLVTIEWTGNANTYLTFDEWQALVDYVLSVHGRLRDVRVSARAVVEDVDEGDVS